MKPDTGKNQLSRYHVIRALERLDREANALIDRAPIRPWGSTDQRATMRREWRQFRLRVLRNAR